MPLADHLLRGSYDDRLVVLSVLISVFASYAALDLRTRNFSAWQCTAVVVGRRRRSHGYGHLVHALRGYVGASPAGSGCRCWLPFLLRRLPYSWSVAAG